MKKPFWKYSVNSARTILYALLSLVGFAIPVGLGVYHRNVNGGEGYHQFYTFPQDRARPVILKLGADGILHRLISRYSLDGTLGLTNTGEPVRIRMQLVGVPEGLTIHWGNSHTRDFDLKTKTVDRILKTGDSVSVHHTFHIAKNLRQKAVIFSGGLEIVDEGTGSTLLTVPIRILNAGLAQAQRTEVVGHAN